MKNLLVVAVVTMSLGSYSCKQDSVMEEDQANTTLQIELNEDATGKGDDGSPGDK